MNNTDLLLLGNLWSWHSHGCQFKRNLWPKHNRRPSWCSAAFTQHTDIVNPVGKCVLSHQKNCSGTAWKMWQKAISVDPTSKLPRLKSERASLERTWKVSFCGSDLALNRWDTDMWPLGVYLWILEPECWWQILRILWAATSVWALYNCSCQTIPERCLWYSRVYCHPASLLLWRFFFLWRKRSWSIFPCSDTTNVIFFCGFNIVADSVPCNNPYLIHLII